MNRGIFFLLLISTFSAAAGQLMLRLGAKNSSQLLDFFNYQIILGLVLYAISTLTWIYSLSKVELVKVYVFTALTFVLVYMGAVLILGESFTLINALGITLILFGLALIVLV